MSNEAAQRRRKKKQSQRQARKDAHNNQAVEMEEVNGLHVHLVDIDNPNSMALLKAAYDQVYRTAFPMDDERESWKVLREGLKDGSATISIGCDSKGKPLGMSIGYYYDEADMGLLGYLATDPQFQGRGIGRTMMQVNDMSMLRMSKENGGSLNGIVLECNPPDTQDDVMDPAKRIAMYKKWDCVELPIFYKQPPLEVGAEGVELRLLAQPHPTTGTYPNKKAIQGYIRGIYEECQENSGIPPEQNPDYLRSVRELPDYLRSVRELNAFDLNKFYAEEQRKKSSPQAQSQVQQQAGSRFMLAENAQKTPPQKAFDSKPQTLGM